MAGGDLSTGKLKKPTLIANLAFLQETFFIPGGSYLYESQLVYECNPAGSFEDVGGVTYDSQTVTCGWDGNWEPAALMSCVCE